MNLNKDMKTKNQELHTWQIASLVMIAFAWCLLTFGFKINPVFLPSPWQLPVRFRNYGRKGSSPLHPYQSIPGADRIFCGCHHSHTFRYTDGDQ